MSFYTWGWFLSHLAKLEHLSDNSNYPMIRTAEFGTLCREHNLAATHQRRVIYETVIGMHGHPSPELIYDTVRKKIPSISLATVYKNVRTFLNSGMLREVSLHHGSIRVEPNESEHHHLVCVRCRQITDLEPDSIGAAPPRIKKRLPRGFRITRIAVDVLGVCASCAAREKQNSASIKTKRINR